MEKFIKFLMYIWQLPQNIAGLVLRIFTPADRKIEKNFMGGDVNVYVSSNMRGGISLGKYIVLSSLYYNSYTHKNTWLHEFGHTRQSRILGPLYLFVIGIPSIVWAGLYGTKLFPRTKFSYYSFYTEKWADKLGGVNRN